MAVVTARWSAFVLCFTVTRYLVDAQVWGLR